MVKLLLSAKADVNVRGEYGSTALYVAVEYRHEAVVKLLLKAKADVNAKDNYGERRRCTWRPWRQPDTIRAFECSMAACVRRGSR